MENQHRMANYNAGRNALGPNWEMHYWNTQLELDGNWTAKCRPLPCNANSLLPAVPEHTRGAGLCGQWWSLPQCAVYERGLRLLSWLVRKRLRILQLTPAVRPLQQ